VRQDLIVQNPATAAQAPKRARTCPDVWTEAQTLLFLSEAKAKSVYHPLYLFLIGTGCRLGEALGLSWRALDLREGIAYIEQTLQRTHGGGYVLKDPKSLRSHRSVTLPPEIAQVLVALRGRQDTERRQRTPCERGVRCTGQACSRWHETGLVFTQPNGKPLHANNIRQHDLRRLCKDLGLSRKRALHNLRHAHGSYLLQRGVSVKVVQERLGHSSAAFTLNTYAHVLQGMQEQAARAVSAMLAGQGDGCYPPATLSSGQEHAQTIDK
jgi:integrase